MSVQTFGPEATVEGLDERIVGRLSGPGEVERDAASISPLIQITGDKLCHAQSARGRPVNKMD